MLSLKHTLTARNPTATRVQVALNIAISASSLCINRRLYKIAILKNVMITRADKRRAVIQDLFICVGIPILQIISRKCAFPFTINRLNKHYPQNTLFRCIGTTYLRILALFLRPHRLRLPSFSSTRGPWRLVL